MDFERTPSRPSVVANTTVGAKGRVVIPASVREAAGLEEGLEMVAIVKGNEHIELMTHEAIDRAVWAAAPKPPPEPGAAGRDIRAMRDEDALMSQARFDELSRRAEQRDPAQVEAAGRRLLRLLGIEGEAG